MAEDRKFVRRYFLVHQYEKEEVFLSQMAKEGWHFIKLHKGIPPTKYEFVKGEKIEYVYQLDYATEEEDTEDYHQLFADAGWEEVFSWDAIGGKWYYFRRVHSAGQDDRIYTDSESKYQMFEKLWKRFGLLLLVSLGLELNGIRSCISALKEFGLKSEWGTASVILCCLFTLFSIVLMYMLTGIMVEKNKIKSRLKQKL